MYKRQFREIEKETGTNGNRHPLTYILEAADDIAYKTADIEDAFIKKFISYHTSVSYTHLSLRKHLTGQSYLQKEMHCWTEM